MAVKKRDKWAMTLEQLLRFQHAEPFRPYRIHLADGKSIDVMHPDFLARSRTGRTVTIYRLDETSEVVDLLLVTRLEPIPRKRRPSARRRSSK